MKKLFCTSLVAMILLSGTISSVNAETISDFKGQKAQVFTSSDANQDSDTDAKTSISVSFIEDENNSDLIALVSIKGFIPSGIRRLGGYWNSELHWPRKYNITVESQDNDDVKIIESIPRNKIETVKVSESIGYSIGGNVSTNKDSLSGGVNTSYNVQHSVSYEQPDFRTIQKTDGLRRAAWDVEFVATKDGYDVNSYHGIYGNQLFMKSRLYNAGIDNLTDDKDLSTLISGGFSPNVVIALKAPKNTDKSKLMLNYSVYTDIYKLQWTATQWFGENKSLPNPFESKHLYEIDWKNHTINKI